MSFYRNFLFSLFLAGFSTVIVAAAEYSWERDPELDKHVVLDPHDFTVQGLQPYADKFKISPEVVLVTGVRLFDEIDASTGRVINKNPKYRGFVRPYFASFLYLLKHGNTEEIYLGSKALNASLESFFEAYRKKQKRKKEEDRKDSDKKAKFAFFLEFHKELMGALSDLSKETDAYIQAQRKFAHFVKFRSQVHDFDKDMRAYKREQYASMELDLELYNVGYEADERLRMHIPQIKQAMDVGRRTSVQGRRRLIDLAVSSVSAGNLEARLKQEFSDENLAFIRLTARLIEVLDRLFNTFPREYDRKTHLALGAFLELFNGTLVNRFIENNGINLPSGIKNAIVDLKKQVNAQGDGGRYIYFSSEENIKHLRNAILAAQKNIYGLLDRDSIPRWLSASIEEEEADGKGVTKPDDQ